MSLVMSADTETACILSCANTGAVQYKPISCGLKKLEISLCCYPDCCIAPTQAVTTQKVHYSLSVIALKHGTQRLSVNINSMQI